MYYLLQLQIVNILYIYMSLTWHTHLCIWIYPIIYTLFEHPIHCCRWWNRTRTRVKCSSGTIKGREMELYMYGIYIYIWNVYHYGILAPQGWTIEPIFITSQQSVKLVKRHLVDFPFDGTYIHAYTVYCEIVTSGRIEMLFYIFSRSPHRVWLILTGIGGVVERNSHVQRWGYHNSF